MNEQVSDYIDDQWGVGLGLFVWNVASKPRLGAFFLCSITIAVTAYTESVGRRLCRADLNEADFYIK